jgi:hypothetical protein
MRRALLFLAWLLAACGLAHAVPDCDPLFTRKDFPDYKHYVLVFLNSGDLKPEQRRELRWKLEDRFNPQLTAFSRELSEKNGARTRYVELVGCDAPVGAADLGSADLKILKGYGVIAAIWRSGDGLTYLTFPFYSSQTDLRREDVEVVLRYRSSSVDPAVAWAELLDQNQAHAAFVALGLALALIEQKELVPAWVTLCESRRALARAAEDAVRPAPANVLKVIGGMIDREIASVSDRVRGSVPIDRFRPPARVEQQCRASAIDAP